MRAVANAAADDGLKLSGLALPAPAAYKVTRHEESRPHVQALPTVAEERSTW